jgi:hypothetical protein
VDVEAFYREHLPFVRSCTARRLHEPSDVVDVTAEVFTSVYFGHVATSQVSAMTVSLVVALAITALCLLAAPLLPRTAALLEHRPTHTVKNRPRSVGRHPLGISPRRRPPPQVTGEFAPHAARCSRLASRT